MVIPLRRWSSARTVIDNVSAPTAAPTNSTNPLQSPDSDFVSYISGTGSGTLRLWLYDGKDWFKGESYDFDGADNPVAVHWNTPSYKFTLQLTAVSDGNVTVKVL